MAEPNREALLAELQRQEALLRDLDRQREEARTRIEKLREQAAAARDVSTQLALTAVPPGNSAPALRASESPTCQGNKLRLFRELFRGREDVYPRYWEKPAQKKKGYSPVCGNLLKQGLCPKCERKKVKCGECPNRRFLPVTDQVILDHFKGVHTIGVYPLLEDDTCWFLAADFDKASWKEDVVAFVETCRAVGLHPAVERSRSGNGGHVWFFFATPIAASVARRMGCYLITETMARRHQLGMDSYDRLFPNQDTMPRGGFGNLIALPFQKKPRKLGHTLFVDDALKPWPDQGVFLASLPRLGPDFVENIAREASRTGQVVGVRPAEPLDEEDSAPWIRLPSGRRRTQRITGPLPSALNVVLAQRLFIAKAGVPSALLNQVQRLAAFQNPVFYKNQSMRLSTRGTPRVISCAEDFPEHLGVPRGCQSDLEALLDEHGVKLQVEDKRTEGMELDVSFRGELMPIQLAAARAMLQHDTGVFVAPPGIGKTVLGIYLVAQRRRSTLILVHRQQLLDQWLAQLAMFLGIDEEEIGQIRGGKKEPNGRLDVAMLQSLGQKGSVDDRVATYGQVIMDECHHLSACSYERVLNQVKARYVVGLTATPQRRDGHHPIIEMQLGPVRFSIDAKSQSAKRPFDHRLIVRETSFALRPDLTAGGIQEYYRELVVDEARNQLIIGDVIRAIQEGRSPILLTERKDHLKFFADRLKSFVRHIVVLEGGRSRKQQKATGEELNSIPDHEERLLLATGKYIGEGFDDARLDTLFLALPISFKGTLVQYTGRLHRLHPRKTEVRIFDYVDRSAPMLLKMFENRLRGYRTIGYARDEAPLGFPPPPAEELTVEYDEEAVHHFEDDD
ncbi:MAG TPA: DEAD/DEAH box helicase family protein [Anaeromyxobacteraceae bacterium]|nr:DEAD/DEAH box helicase family protein [Anaeromyxobacteraceae bacterium]